MPQLGGEASIATTSPARIMIYGREKTRKTMWALGAAQAGFNVLLIDGDDGAHIAAQYKPADICRVGLVRCVDSPAEYTFVKLVKTALVGKPFAYREADQKLMTKTDDKPGWFECDGLLKASRNDVLIIDSWTALTSSMKLQYSLANQIDLGDAEKTDWPGYGWMQNLTDYLLDCIHHLPCHVVVVAHEQIYEKYKGVGRDRVLDWQRTQPLGASGNTSGRLGKHFSDIFRFVGKGAKSTSVEAFGKSDQVGGSRYFKPGSFTYAGPDEKSDPTANWDFAQYAKQAKMVPTGGAPTFYRFK